ncbi:MAG: hypothetical protein KatS3mg131_0611 [Candidatus Tectimicrobiota bacterium]|nr:MAG: hypothetical protein KatS3mg131_0611 [Candidatus Tectomicrobia bacterium]
MNLGPGTLAGWGEVRWPAWGPPAAPGRFQEGPVISLALGHDGVWEVASAAVEEGVTARPPQLLLPAARGPEIYSARGEPLRFVSARGLLLDLYA